MTPRAPRATYKRVKREISIRATTYERLKELARRNGEHISTTVDAIILSYLDARKLKS